MNLSQIEKRIPQTLKLEGYNPNRPRICSPKQPGQINARPGKWGLGTVQKNLSRESWGDFSGDRYIICPKPPYPAEKILDRRQLWLDKWKSSKLDTGSRIQSFLSAFPSPNEASVLSVSEPNIVCLGSTFAFQLAGISCRKTLFY